MIRKLNKLYADHGYTVVSMKTDQYVYRTIVIDSKGEIFVSYADVVMQDGQKDIGTVTLYHLVADGKEYLKQ